MMLTAYDIPYSVKRWRRKTLANQQNITLAKKTLANNLLWRSSRNEWWPWGNVGGVKLWRICKNNEKINLHYNYLAQRTRQSSRQFTTINPISRATIPQRDQVQYTRIPASSPVNVQYTVTLILTVRIK